MRIAAGSSLPSTPQKRSSDIYLGLLASFGAKSSATSTTQERRRSSNVVPSKRIHSPGMANDVESKLEPTQRMTPGASHSMALSNASATNGQADGSELAVTTQDDVLDTPLHCDETADNEGATAESSGDELAKTPRDMPAGKFPRTRRTLQTDPRTQTGDRTGCAGELKMEARKSERLDRPRRSMRGKRESILESDMVQEATPTRKPKKKEPRKAKLDTARQRLRDDIASHTKAKANNFLVANQQYFRPLLPPHNYISKLAAKGDSTSIVDYEELSAQPKGVKAIMKPYQLSGLSFLVHLYNNGFSGILGDEMGLGKTLQTLSLFQYLEEEDEKANVVAEELRPYLVICPLSVLDSWVNEAKKWVPDLKVLRFQGSVTERDRLKRVAQGIEDTYGNETNQSRDRKTSRKAGLQVSKLPTEDLGNGSYKIIVTTYEAFQAEQNWFKHSFVWRYVVLDEGHRIKSNVTQISQALRNVSAEFRLILTGTPLQNNLVEMWSLLAWLYPDVFTSNTESLFRESFDLTRGKINQQTLDDARRLLELVMLRRMKDSPGVNLGLPEKEEVLLYVPLTPMQRFWYTRLLTRVDEDILDDLFTNVQSKEKLALRQELADEKAISHLDQLQNGTALSQDVHGWEETATIMKQALAQEQNNTDSRSAWQKLMNLVMQLRKCCSHPYLLPGAVPDPYYLGEHVIRASGKFILLEKLLKRSILEQGKKILIFSGFTHTLDCCEDLLELISEHGQKFKHLRFDGGTVRARRNLDIRLFNKKNSEYKVMLLSTRAGGLGINLTSAEDVVFLDEDWNPQITLQAEARAHRIGQTKKVTIYKLCTQGTVEEQMMGRIRKKLYLSAKITESMNNIHGKQNTPKSDGRSKVSEDMPQMDTTQLKSLVRRGAQTLSHPEINATEMLSWDLDTMLQKCRDKPSDLLNDPAAATTAMDEEKWLSGMERVECAVFDGKRYQRQIDKGISGQDVLPDSITREDRRKGKNVTVMVDGFAISKESLNCKDWEAVPTLAGKDPRLADSKRAKKRQITHEPHCLICFDDESHGDISCKSCPRSYHFKCLNEQYQAKAKSFTGFYCPQHECIECGKRTADAGGLIFRCRWCERGFCEDHLEWGKEVLVGENLPEFEVLNEEPTGGFYISCPTCKETAEGNEDHKEWLQGIQADYEKQYARWLKTREEDQRDLAKRRDQEQSRIEEAQSMSWQNAYNNEANGQFHYADDNDAHSAWGSMDGANAPSPPGLTDTSVPTPAPGVSRVCTPRLNGHGKDADDTRKRPLFRLDGSFHESSKGKRARTDDGSGWDTDEDSILSDRHGYKDPLANHSKKDNSTFSRYS